jgi:hypothetical protein
MDYMNERQKTKIKELEKDFKLTREELVSLAYISYKTWNDYTTEKKACDSLVNVLGMFLLSITSNKGKEIVSKASFAYNGYVELYNQFGGNAYWLAYHFYCELLNRMYNLNSNKMEVKSKEPQGFDYEF